MQEIFLNDKFAVANRDHTSKGNQPKWQYRNNWYKADHMGYESLSEVLVSRLLAKSNVQNFVVYEPIIIQNKSDKLVGCVSRDFKGAGNSVVSVEALHRSYFGKGLASVLGTMKNAADRIKYTVNVISEKTGLTGVGEYITAILEIDAFFLNEDRHTNNIAFIRREDAKKQGFEFTPVFDNGLSLLSDLNDYPPPKNIYDCISCVKAKPFSTSFDEQLDAAEELFGKQIAFGFDKNDVTAALSDMKELYDKAISDRVEAIIFEQMRKYSYFFE